MKFINATFNFVILNILEIFIHVYLLCVFKRESYNYEKITNLSFESMNLFRIGSHNLILRIKYIDKTFNFVILNISKNFIVYSECF